MKTLMPHHILYTLTREAFLALFNITRRIGFGENFLLRICRAWFIDLLKFHNFIMEKLFQVVSSSTAKMGKFSAHTIR